MKQWDAHLLTKQHRQSVARVKKEEEKDARKRERAAASAGAGEEGQRKRAKVDKEEAPTSNLPAGFFSAGGPSVGDEEDEEAPAPAPVPAGTEAGPGVGKEAENDAGGTGVDEDLDAFLSSLAEVEEDATPVAAAPPVVAKKRSKYKDIPEGVASYSAAPVMLNGEPEAEEEPEEEETPAERRARLAREEKEEIFQRLDDEQRAQ